MNILTKITKERNPEKKQSDFQILVESVSDMRQVIDSAPERSKVADQMDDCLNALQTHYLLQ